MLNLADAAERGELPARIALVIASRECPGAERARARGLPVRVMPGDIPAGVLGPLLREAGASVVVLAGYLRLVDVPEGFEGRVVNIHPALLPSFGGPGMYGDRVHRAVLEAGCKVSGCTAHVCDGRYDTGPILAQAACPVLPGDTPATLGARVFALETEMYPRVVRALVEGRVRVLPGGVAEIEPG